MVEFLNISNDLADIIRVNFEYHFLMYETFNM
jgi:hypothetical protein